MPWSTPEEVLAQSSVAELTSLTLDQVTGIRESSIAAIQEYCSTTFEPVDKTIIMDGQGAQVLYLPERLASMESISVNGAVIPGIVVSGRGDRLNFTNEHLLGYYEQALAHVSGQQIPTGFGNVSITGTWGYEDVPDAVNQALRYDMEDTARAEANGLSATVAAYRKLGIRQVSQGGMSADVMGNPGLTVRVQAVLAPYIWEGQIGAVA